MEWTPTTRKGREKEELEAELEELGIEVKREKEEGEDDDDYDGGGFSGRRSRRGSKWSEARGREAKYVPRPVPSERTTELFKRIRSCQGTVAVEVSRSPLTEADGKMEKRKETELMAAFGLMQSDGEGVQALPLAWTPLEEVETEDPLPQYNNYTSALQSVFGYSPMEVRYRSYVFTRMGSDCYKENRSSKRRYKLKRDHAGATNEELRNILDGEDVVRMTRRGPIKPFFCRDMEFEAETQTWSLVSELPMDDLEGVAVVYFREDGSAPAFFLQVREESREDDAYCCIKSVMDLW